MIISSALIIGMENVLDKKKLSNFVIETINNGEMNKNFIMQKNEQIALVMYKIYTNKFNKKILEVDSIETKHAWRR